MSGLRFAALGVRWHDVQKPQALDQVREALVDQGAARWVAVSGPDPRDQLTEGQDLVVPLAVGGLASEEAQGLVQLIGPGAVMQALICTLFAGLY